MRVPVPVEVDRCPVTALPLPPEPIRDLAACRRAFGDDLGPHAVCYAPGESHRLAALLDVLIDLYLDVTACPPAAPITPTEGATP